ncbi:DMT family transporter [Streptomyces sp. NPDC051940]|uniref:DMT family transporter n=1 Tax=Streptomyces sp. NPDC051940 TaxID=3155675 RepID=UPI00343EF4F9
MYAALLLALASAVAYASGAVLQERIAGRASAVKALRQGGWWVAVGLNIAGALLHIVALRYGPLTVIQPLGALTLVLALPLQAAVTGRRVGATQWKGAALTMTGLAGIVVVTQSDGHLQVLGGAQIAGVVGATAAVLAALGLGARFAGSATGRSLALATSSGLAFGVASVLTQTVAVRPSFGPGTVLAAVAVAVLSPGGLLLAQAGYGNGLGAPLATSNLVNPGVAAAIGIALLGEQFAFGGIGVLAALAAGLVATYGVLLLTRPVRVAAAWAPASVRVPRRAATSYALTR